MGKIKKLFTLLFASLALSIGAVSIISSNDNNIKNADADVISPIYEEVNGREYRVIYYYIDTNWEYTRYYYTDWVCCFGFGNYDHLYVYGESGDYSDDIPFGTQEMDGDVVKSFSEVISDFCAKIYLPKTATTLYFCTSKDKDYYSSSDYKYFTKEEEITYSTQVFIVTKDNYSDNKRTECNSITKDSLFNNYFRYMYVTVDTGWLTDNSKTMTDLYIFVKHTGSDGKTIGRPFRVTSNMVFTPTGESKEHAKILVSCKSGTTVRLQNGANDVGWDDSPPDRDSTNDIEITKQESRATLHVTSNTSSKQTTKWGMLGEKTNYYIIGDGSFTNGGAAWSFDSGVNLNTNSDDKGAVLSHYFESGDIFKIYNYNDNTGSGWEKNTATGTDTTNVTHTAFNDAAGTSFRLYLNSEALNISHWWGTEYWYPADGVAYAYLWNSNTGESNGPYNDSDDGPTVMKAQTANKLYYIDINDGVRYNKVIFHDKGGNHTPDLDLAWYMDNDQYTFSSCSDQILYGDFTWSNASNSQNIIIKETGYYDIRLMSDGKIKITAVSNVVAGDSIYLNLNNVWGTQGHIAAHFWNSSGTINVEMHKINGCEWDTTVYECSLPLIDGSLPTGLLFYRSSSFDPESFDPWNKTDDTSFSFGSNVFRINYWSGGDYGNSGGEWSGYLTHSQRVKYFGIWFNTCVVCDGQKMTTDNWSDAKDEYSHICDNVKNLILSTTAVAESSEPIESALSKYDYIIDHYPSTEITDSHYDFIGRNRLSGSGKATPANRLVSFNPFANITEGKVFSTIIIIIASSIALLSITGLSVLMIRKRKTKE